MGDPRKPKLNYQTPMHPWQKERIDFEKKLIREYGLKNKKEVWKHSTQVKRFISKFKDTSIKNPDQAKKEKNDLLNRMVRIGLIKQNATGDEILGLNVQNILDRRLQTLVHKKGLARSVKQARQFIVHRHIMVNGKVVTAPSYIVSVEDEPKITFVTRSALFSEEHPERGAPIKPGSKKQKIQQETTDEDSEEALEVGEKIQEVESNE